jgi:hypothetical protein
MSDEISPLAVEVGEVLAAFAAEQRAIALAEPRKKRIVMRRNVNNSCEVSLETVLSEDATAEEVYEALAPVNAAIDRLANKAELAGHYEAILNKAGLIEQTMRKMAEDQVHFQAEASTRVVRINQRKGEDSRESAAMTKQQRDVLAGHRKSIVELFNQVEELKRASAENLRIIAGEDPFDVLRQQIEDRLDKLRGTLPADAVAA